MIHCIKKNNKY